jgi:hypothetical protein
MRHIITLHEAMVVATLGTSSPGCMSPVRTVVLAQRSPRLGELVVVVGWVSGREEDHVIAIAKGHELQTPRPDLHGQRKWTFGVSHSEEWRESDAGTQQSPYLARQLSLFGPGRALSRRVNLCCVLPNPDGDAKRIYESLSWFG